MSNKKIRYESPALNELADAVKWYEEQEIGLGQKFLETIYKIQNLLKIYPSMYPAVEKSKNKNSLRKAYVLNFPYALYYYIIKDEVVITAVFDCRRNPLDLLKRLR